MFQASPINYSFKKRRLIFYGKENDKSTKRKRRV
jgi:hypothetical protein